MKSQRTLTSSRESADFPSHRKRRDSKPLVSAKEKSSAGKSCKNTGQACRSTATSENSTEQAIAVSRSSQADSPANHLASRASKEARKITATSGRRCFELLHRLDPLGCLAKTLLASSDWLSTKFSLIWKPKATPQGRLLFQLAPSKPHTEEIASGLFLGTPTAKFTERSKRFRGKAKTPNPAEFVKMFLTPTASDSKGVSSGLKRANEPERLSHRLCPKASQGTIYPHPEFVEALMGFPAGWTDLKLSATPSFPK